MKRFLIASASAAAVTACALVLAAAAIRSEQGKPAVVKPAPRDEAGIYGQRLAGVRLGTPVQHRGLEVYPLLGGSQAPFYDTLDSALKKGSLVIEELSRVNEARVTNKGSRPVLILDGEQIVGAKQNRVFNSSLLAPPGESLTAKVSCVEHGRWSGVSVRFEASGLQLFARARQANQAAVARNMASAGAPLSDQAGIWADVAAKNRALDVRADTDAMQRAFEAKAADVSEYVERIRPVPGQVGAIFAVHGDIVGLDLFDSEKTLKEIYPKLIKSYALDAISPLPPRGASTLGGDRKSAEEFLDAAAKADGTAYPSQGEGKDLRVSGWQITGSALVARGRVVHAAVFAGEGSSEKPDDSATSIAPPGVRRR